MMSKYTEAVERGLEGLSHVSGGICPGCPDCPEVDEGFFSHAPCDCCNSTLGGDRYAAHGADPDGDLIHLDVCPDCVAYLANGEELEV